MIERVYPATAAPPDYKRSTPRSGGQSAPWLRANDIQELMQPLEELITKYPAAALASAFLVGVALACWIKRK